MPTTCPRCQSADCCLSPWQSDDERRAHRGARPWRCKHCLHRFFVSGGLRRLQDNPVVATVGASTLFMVAVVLAIMWWWKSGG